MRHESVCDQLAATWLTSFCQKGVPVVQDNDENSTDLMKCIESLQEKENSEGSDVGVFAAPKLHHSVVC
jgi:hypothetical protein